MSSTKSAIILSASPKASGDTVSGFLSSRIKSSFETDGCAAMCVDVGSSLKKEQCEKAYEAMAKADALVFVFPLYFFCVPGMLMRFMQNYAMQGYKNKPGQKVYAVINCGFPEPDINSEAIRVIQSFCRHTGATFGFGIGIGGGGMLMGTQDAPFMKKMMGELDEALHRAAMDICGNGQPTSQPVMLRANVPRRLYYFMGNWGWKQVARKNGLKRKMLYAKPYQKQG